jgi:hypothetical protein
MNWRLQLDEERRRRVACPGFPARARLSYLPQSPRPAIASTRVGTRVLRSRRPTLPLPRVPSAVSFARFAMSAARQVSSSREEAQEPANCSVQDHVRQEGNHDRPNDMAPVDHAGRKHASEWGKKRLCRASDQLNEAARSSLEELQEEPHDEQRVEEPEEIVEDPRDKAEDCDARDGASPVAANHSCTIEIGSHARARSIKRAGRPAARGARDTSCAPRLDVKSLKVSLGPRIAAFDSHEATGHRANPRGGAD